MNTQYNIKFIKRILCFLISVLLISSAAVCAFAQYEADSHETVTETENAIQKAEDEETVDVEEKEEKIVAEIYLCACFASKNYPFGHCWICLKNISDESLVIGDQVINPNQMVSVSNQPGKGMTFNKEMEQFKGKTATAMKSTLTMEQFEKVSEEIQSEKWSWYELFTHNCTNFSATVWKSATNRFLVQFCFPFVIMIQMRNTIKLEIV